MYSDIRNRQVLLYAVLKEGIKVKELLKNKKRTVVIAAAMALVLLVGGISISANAATSVKSYVVSKGALSSVLEINGSVETDVSKDYYSMIGCRVGKIHVKEGDYVKKGDLIISYDETELTRLASIAEYDASINAESYNDSVQTGNKAAGLYYGAKKNLKDIDATIMALQAQVTQKECELLEKRAAYADQGAKLQVSLIEWSDEPDSEEYENLQKLIQTNAYEQQYAPEIVDMQEELNVLNTQLAYYKEMKSENTSQRAASVMSVPTEGGKAKLEAIKASNEVADNARIENYNDAKNGIRAEYDGIVTAIDVTEGSEIMSNDKMATLKSTADIVIKCNVNKYDIVNIEEGQTATVNIKNKTYTGTVSRIAHMARDSGQSTGIDVEIRLDEPDSDIILGIEAKAKVTTADLADAISVPLAALNEDEDGAYVFVLRDGKVYKTFVETGVKNDDSAQILSGVSEGETVVWNDTTMLTDGMSVKVE